MANGDDSGLGGPTVDLQNALVPPSADASEFGPPVDPTAFAPTTATAPTNQLVQPPVATPTTPVQPTRFDMAYGDSLATMQSTNRIDPRMANNRIWGVEGPQYTPNSLPIGQSPNDIWTTNEVGAPPKRIADRIEYQLKENPNFFTTDVNGNPINNMFLGIGSNSPGQIKDVERALDALKAANPNLHVVVPGMGPRVPTPNVDAANAALKQAVESRGYTFFQPNLRYADGVHPANSGQMFDQANTVLNLAKPPTPTNIATPTPPVAGTLATGLPQPNQTQAPTNALATGLPAPQSPPGAATAAAPDLSTIYPGTKLEDAIMKNENAPVGSPRFKMFSPAGAVGPAQILPSTGAPYLSRMLGRPVSSDEATQLLQNTDTNIKVRDALLTDLKNKYSYLGPQVAPLAVAAAYHSGEGNADAWLMGEKQLGPAGQKYVADTAAQMGLDTSNLKLGSYARPPLSSTSGGYGVGGAIPRAGGRAAAETPTNPLMPTLADDPSKTGGAQSDSAAQWQADMARRQQIQNAIMDKLIKGAYAAQGLRGVKIDPRTLESGYDPRRVVEAATTRPPPYSNLVGGRPEPMTPPRTGVDRLPEGRIEIEPAAERGRARLLRRQEGIIG